MITNEQLEVCGGIGTVLADNVFMYESPWQTLSTLPGVCVFYVCVFVSTIKTKIGLKMGAVLPSRYWVLM